MVKRTPPPDSEPQPSLPHDDDREDRQPYAKEVEDYNRGVVNPPEDQSGRAANRRTPKARMNK